MGLLDRIGGGFQNAWEGLEKAQTDAAARLSEAAKSVKETIASPTTSPAAQGLRDLRENVQQKLVSSLAKLQAQDGGVDSTGRIGWLKRTRPPAEPTRDVTARFSALNGAAGTGDRSLPADAKNYEYVLVPGLFTERYPGYMDANEGRLKELGLSTRRASVDTDASVEANAKIVRDAILEASKNGKQVVLIGHSKGGVDAAAALALYPELKPHVRAFVAMQTPYGGSPIANDTSNCPTLKPTVDGFIKGVFKGDPDSLKDLSYDRRQAFLRDHPLPTGIPTVSLATSHSKGPSITQAASQYISARYGEKSDGLVPAKDAEIPGSNVVRLDDMDHAMAAMGGPKGVCKYDPGDVTQALVTLALTSPPPR